MSDEFEFSYASGDSPKSWNVFAGDCRETMRLLAMQGIQVDAVVTDPPYHLTSIVKRFGKEGSAPAQFGTDGAFSRASKGFMGKSWDGGDIAFQPETWKLVFDVMKPGAYLAAFGGTRNWHRMVCAIEDAGFEIRDSVMWVYGTGFPKSHNVSKAIDKAAGKTREVLSEGNPVKRMIPGADQDSTGSWVKDNGREYTPTTTAPATPEAEYWEGYGSSLKPAWESICIAQKPFTGTIANCCLTNGVGALNIDACRIPCVDKAKFPEGAMSVDGCFSSGLHIKPRGTDSNCRSRWPANVILDGSEEITSLFPESKGQQGLSSDSQRSTKNVYGEPSDAGKVYEPRNDSGSAARFFYSAKANKKDRLDSSHPTVKPISLIQWLVRLVCPHDGLILDPFAGSGTTGEACMREGHPVLMCEAEEEYLKDIKNRMETVEERIEK